MSRVKEFKLPDLAEGLTEGEILKWFVKPGDEVTLNQPVVEVETAKAAVEIPSPFAGVVTEIFHGDGETVPVGERIFAVDTDPGAGPLPDKPAAADDEESEGGRTKVLVGYGAKQGPAKRRPRKAPPARPSAAPEKLAEPDLPLLPTIPDDLRMAAKPTRHGGMEIGRALEKAHAAREPVAAPPGPALAKPPVRKLAKDLGVDLTTLTGTGPHGSISRDDVLAAAHGPVAPAVAAPTFGPGREQRIPIKGVRKLTAQNMVASAFTAPHVTEFLTVDVTRTMKAVGRLKEMPGWQDVRVSPLLLVAKAVLVALRRHPMVNSSWDEARGDIVVKEYVNLGVAAATDRGLIVPNVKDAGRLSLRELADALTGLVSTARAGKTAPADMAGGTFTITNVGVFGVDTGTPILPPGEAAILAFGAIRKQPWVHKGKVKPREVTTLGLSFDHRIIDGQLGSEFLRDVGAFLADPGPALLAWT